MNSFQLFLSIILFLVAAWFAWRYYDLKKRVDEYARLARIAPERLPTDQKQIENLSNAISSLKAAFDIQLSSVNSENARLSTVLEQLTD
ncbi:MAG TPA: hypothetical protein PKV19_00260, partial [Anaerolineales bacterium]|nr:hypothetical protein [Anaerolineales bacterium]